MPELRKITREFMAVRHARRGDGYPTLFPRGVAIRVLEQAPISGSDEDAVFAPVRCDEEYRIDARTLLTSTVPIGESEIPTKNIARNEETAGHESS